MNSKGLELSMTIIVVLILSILMFIGGIALVWQFFTGAEEIKAEIDRQTQAQIESLLRQGTEITAIPINTKTVAAGKEVTFGLGVRNIHPEPVAYWVLVGFEEIYDQSGRTIGTKYSKSYIEEHWLGAFAKQEEIRIDKKDFKIIPLRVRTRTSVDEGVSTPRGVLVAFNVCVIDHALTVDIPCTKDFPPIELYDGKIKQIFVNVK